MLTVLPPDLGKVGNYLESMPYSAGYRDARLAMVPRFRDAAAVISGKNIDEFYRSHRISITTAEEMPSNRFWVSTHWLPLHLRSARCQHAAISGRPPEAFQEWRAS